MFEVKMSVMLLIQFAKKVTKNYFEQNKHEKNIFTLHKDELVAQ